MLSEDSLTPEPAIPPDVVELPSRVPFGQAVARLEERLLTLAENGLEVFARIDHQANALAVGLDLPATLLVIFGNPKAGTPLMLARPALALDLPLRILVRETAVGTVVAYHAPARMVEAYGLAEEDAAPLQAVAGIAHAIAG